MAKVKQHMGVAVNGPTPSLGVPFVAQPTLASVRQAPRKRESPPAPVTLVAPRAASPAPRRSEPRATAAETARSSIGRGAARLATSVRKSVAKKAPAKKAPATKAALKKAVAKRQVAPRAVVTSARVERGAKPSPGRSTRVRGSDKSKSISRKTARPKSAVVEPVAGARRSATKGKAPKGAALGKRANKHRIEAAQLPVARVVKIKALDPFQKCGPRTSVVHLLRVDERHDGSSAVHLVFFDRHGWYCEHGPACRAVEDVRRQSKQLGLTI